MENSTVQKRCEVRCKMEQKGKQKIRVQMGEYSRDTEYLEEVGGISCLHNGN